MVTLEGVCPRSLTILLRVIQGFWMYVECVLALCIFKSHVSVCELFSKKLFTRIHEKMENRKMLTGTVL